MKFSCVKENIEYALNIAERFTGKNLMLPILGNILIETEENNISVIATNLESAVKISVPGKNFKNGRVSIPAKIINPLIQSVKEEKIDFEEKQGNVLIKTETRDIKINGIPPDDFPLLPKIKKTHSFLTDGFSLGRGLEKVLPAVSTSEFKPELTGVYFKTSVSKLYLVATDTFRLAEKNINLSKKPESSISFILPARVTAELTRILGDGDEEVNIGVGDNQVVFETDKTRVISRTLDGSFPEYSAIIPKEFDSKTFLGRREFMDAVKASSIFASKLNDVTLHLRSKNLEVTSLNQEIGEYKTSIPCKISGKDITLSFNYRYLLDGITSLDEDEFFMGVNAENKPSLLQNKNDPSFLYVIMPIRLT